MRGFLKYLSIFLMSYTLVLANQFGFAADLYTFTPEQQARCVDKAFEQLGVYNFENTNPTLLKKVLEEDMFLGGFDLFTQQMLPHLQEKTSFLPMLNAIRAGILNRHPAIADALCMAIQKNVLQDASKIQLNIQRTLHHMFLLDALVKSMKDMEFLIALKQYFASKKESYGIRSSCCKEYCDIRKITGSFFKAAKLVTVDKITMRQYINFRKNPNITGLDVVRKNLGLKLNIQEARSEDLKNAAYDNAMVASVLSGSLVRDIEVDSNRGVVIQKLAPEWDSLYQTWNIAFVMRNLDDLEYILPKLLIPEVINADPWEYLYKRGIALWPTTNFQLFREATHIKPVVSNQALKDFATYWGQINLKYAKKFVQQNNSSHEDDFLHTYNHSMYWEFRYGIKSLISYAHQ
jgi:hypothetical protein